MVKKIIGVVLFVVFIAIAIYLGYALQNQHDYAAEDSSALYGGVAEAGYPSAGYVFTVTNEGAKTCGFAVLDGETGVTAGHCVDGAVRIYLGKGIFKSERTEDIRVTRAIQKEGWVNSQDRTDDFSILKFPTTDYFDGLAEVAAPTEGCNLRVVAYGKTEDPTDAPMTRKSAKVCATEIGSKTFQIQSDKGDSGICFGDSGSPVYIDGTNKLVGNVVSIINEVKDDPDPCDFNNRAIVVRTDTNTSLVVNSKNDTNLNNLPSTGVSKDFTIEVANQNFLTDNAVVLKWNSLETKQKYSYGLYVGGSLLLVAALYLIFKLATMKEENTPQKLV